MFYKTAYSYQQNVIDSIVLDVKYELFSSLKFVHSEFQLLIF